ncbi:hypothetical protein HAX54_052505, partial [Datura stramonium]|nr:hypothetical protein [Datura stramonium]
SQILRREDNDIQWLPLEAAEDRRFGRSVHDPQEKKKKLTVEDRLHHCLGNSTFSGLCSRKSGVLDQILD